VKTKVLLFIYFADFTETKLLWNIREIGDKMQYNQPGGQTVQYSTIVIRNLRWPGAYCITKVCYKLTKE